jgi:antitoxin CptB
MTDGLMQNDLDTRRRRAIYRATHRGTKEMDWLLGRYAEARVASMAEADLSRFEQMVSLADPDLQGWLLDASKPATGDLAPEIEAVRAFHGVGKTPAE